MSNQVSEKQLLLQIQPLIENHEAEAVRLLLEAYRPEDIADIFWDIELDEAKFIIKVVGQKEAVEIRRLATEMMHGAFANTKSYKVGVQV